jgi:hypothetical protein
MINHLLTEAGLRDAMGWDHRCASTTLLFFLVSAPTISGLSAAEKLATLILLEGPA